MCRPRRHLPSWCLRSLTLVTKRPSIYVCIVKTWLTGFVTELFPIEEMRHYCKMGRGRKGLIEQSETKQKSSRGSGERSREIMSYFYVSKSDEKKFLSEEAVEIMKHMNPQQLVNFLLPNDDWHVKTSTSNASGS